MFGLLRRPGLPALLALAWQAGLLVASGPSSLRLLLLAASGAAVAWAAALRRGALPGRVPAALLAAGAFWIAVLEATLLVTPLLARGLVLVVAAAAVHATILASGDGSGETGLRSPRLGVALSAAAVTLFLGESVCRAARGLHTYDALPDGPGPPHCLFRDASGRARAAPGFRGAWVHRDFPGVRVAINDWGLRDDLDQAGPPEDGEVPVVVLGDSFAFGLGVELEDCFAERIETGARRVYAAGVPGYGLRDDRAMLEDLATVLRPAAVVVSLFEGNDFQDTLSALGREPAAPAPPGSVTPRPAAAPLRRFLRAVGSAAFWRDSCALLQLGSDRGAGRSSLFVRAVLAGERSERVERAVEAVFGELQALRSRCDELGSELVVLVVPSFLQADPRRFALHAEAEGRPLERTAFHEELVGRLERGGFRVVDTLPRLEAEARDGRDCYHPEGHWNARGHAVAADLLDAVL